MTCRACMPTSAAPIRWPRSRWQSRIPACRRKAGPSTSSAATIRTSRSIVSGGQKLAALLLFVNDVHSLGLKTAQGLSFTESFYWDMNDNTRAWSKRFAEKVNNHAMPSMNQAGNYAAVLHYLKALEALDGNPHD